MEYEEALEWIHSREKFKIKPGLERMKAMMAELGHPEKQLRAVHIAGTNGKGSTVSFLRSLLQQQGYQVGTFTSPYIVRFNERISLTGVPIDDEELVKLVEKIEPITKKIAAGKWGEPTEFETITAMAFLYFANKEPDVVLLETGLGGRYDSTNVIEPMLAIITNVGLDHLQILGDTHEDIAYEKAGIIKPAIPTITGVTVERAFKVIRKQALQMHSPLLTWQTDFKTTPLFSDEEGEHFNFFNDRGEKYAMTSPLKGRHQISNAALALQAAEILHDQGFTLNSSLYQQGLRATNWPARFEIMQKEPTVILDGAHNLEGVTALMNTLEAYYPDEKKTLLFTALKDKPLDKMVPKLTAYFDQTIFTTFDFPRSLTGEELRAFSPVGGAVENTYQKVISNFQVTGTENEILVIAGSLYFVSDARKYFEKNTGLC
ncbi:folylpolyglutamate synthase/dihydrofolate synthase family protein [Thalassobacillus sp. CUG 92003]|uniref:bifunctional folylpolyglutamate synthase/dihydrofolate synthase n=1 Tax=Thalassobacillus sp. CUG 92003 TaxID=2736641 RepID=UPI0015E7E495|nr:folylpolyglutamate synthase/dihydrofolate synthase family protein [Thalassobacillus sp. CUG 92003]